MRGDFSKHAADNPLKMDPATPAHESKRVALVTGAGRGIGKAISRALARQGIHVVLTARGEEELGEVCRELEAEGGKALVAPADVSSEDDVKSLFSRVRHELGQLDILVNNAGVGTFGPMESFAREDFDRIFAVNTRGAFLCCREAVHLMKPREQGYIINISSVVGIRGYPDQSVYGASKHALMGLTKSLAVEVQKYGIRVSAILPGGVATDLIGRARPDIESPDLMHPDDVARVVLFLLSLPDRAAIDEITIRRRNSSPW